MKRIILGFLITLFTYELTITDADAWIFRRLFRRRSYSSQNYGNSYNIGGTPQQICEQKAAIQAGRCRMYHPGGSFGGARYEGCGSGMTPDQALNNCCYSNSGKVIAGEAVVQGSNGRWYATRLFW